MAEKIPENVLEALRSLEVLPETDERSGVTKNTIGLTPVLETGNVPPAFLNSLRELNKRRDAFLASLAGLPIEKFVIGPEEMERVREAANLLRVFMDNYEREYANIEVADRLGFDKKKMEELIAELDKLSVWGAKFATQCSGGASSDVPLQEYNRDEDSLYYMTPRGATMRIKTIELPNGLRRVIQPFTEKILFVGPGGELSEVPREGYTVEEYLSGSFSKAITENNVGGYQSGLQIYRRGNEVAAIAHKSAQEQTSFSPAHIGDRVNKIFFSR